MKSGCGLIPKKVGLLYSQGEGNNLLCICKRAYGVTWGLRPKVVHWLYISILRPSVLHPYFDGLAVRRLVPKRSKKSTKTCMFRDNGSNAQCHRSIYLPPPLELLVQSEVRLAAHHLWSLGCWSQIHTNQGHSSIWMKLQ